MIRPILVENWLLRKIPAGTLAKTVGLIFLVFIGTNLYLNDLLGAQAWMPASPNEVFQRHEYWRAWTTLFAHGDEVHILSNMVLFFPFAYFLLAFFGPVFFPFGGFLIGGLINLVVLKTMPEDAHLIGVSGVVYWMGASWITLAFFINRHEKKHKRILKAMGVSLILFVPETYKPEVSYLAHLVGYVFGVVSGCLYYRWKRSEFRAAEVFEFELEEDSSGGVA